MMGGNRIMSRHFGPRIICENQDEKRSDQLSQPLFGNGCQHYEYSRTWIDCLESLDLHGSSNSGSKMWRSFLIFRDTIPEMEAAINIPGALWTRPPGFAGRDKIWISGQLSLRLKEWGCPADLLTSQAVLNLTVHGHTSRAPPVGINPTSPPTKVVALPTKPQMICDGHPSL